MSDGMAIENGKLVITKGARTVATTDGTLVCLLPTALSLTGKVLTFPDFSKSTAYFWLYEMNRTLVIENGNFVEYWEPYESCQADVTATPEETSVVTALADVPAGADFFVGRVKLTRTTGPANTWMGRALGVLPVTGQWMPIPGAFSALMEADIGMARAAHIYIDNDAASATYRKLVMVAQQSVGPSMGGYGSFGHGASPGADGGGGAITGSGLAIVAGSSKDATYSKNRSYAAVQTQLAQGGSHQCSAPSTNHSSVYSLDITGRFGRRS